MISFLSQTEHPLAACHAFTSLFIHHIYLVDFFPVALSVGALYIHTAQNATKPVAVAAMPESHGHAPEMT
jgi:hypothetical protein